MLMAKYLATMVDRKTVNQIQLQVIIFMMMTKNTQSAEHYPEPEQKALLHTKRIPYKVLICYPNKWCRIVPRTN